MLRITKVVCPVDFSAISRRALDHAAVLARWYEAELHILHVLPLMPTVFGFPSPADHRAQRIRWAACEPTRIRRTPRTPGLGERGPTTLGSSPRGGPPRSSGRRPTRRCELAPRRG